MTVGDTPKATQQRQLPDITGRGTGLAGVPAKLAAGEPLPQEDSGRWKHGARLAYTGPELPVLQSPPLAPLETPPFPPLKNPLPPSMLGWLRGLGIAALASEALDVRPLNPGDDQVWEDLRGAQARYNLGSNSPADRAAAVAYVWARNQYSPGRFKDEQMPELVAQAVMRDVQAYPWKLNDAGMLLQAFQHAEAQARMGELRAGPDGLLIPVRSGVERTPPSQKPDNPNWRPSPEWPESSPDPDKFKKEMEEQEKRERGW